MQDASHSKSTVGRVFFVGAGPGDPKLLTLRGAECLAIADLVLYDGLVNPLLLRHTNASAERTCRVDGPSGLTIRQDEINQRLIEAALAGKTVVRLKGGDPFVFGRGSEEAAALEAVGIPYEVVPGITAATAAAVYTGISLTHRDYSSAVAFVTGHEDPTKSTSLDYKALSAFPGTLVFYMGLHRLNSIATSLIAAGKPTNTPVSVVSHATRPTQRMISGTLADISSLAKAGELHAPSLVIVGECVRHRQPASWFENRPLLGQVIGITRPEDQADEAALRAIELGAVPILLPTIEIAPPGSWDEVDSTLSKLSDFQFVIFTSVNGVHGLLGRLWKSGRDIRSLAHTKLAAIGPSTATALEKYSLRADLVPAEFRAEALAEILKPHVAGKKVLWARASRGRDVLPQQLAAAGAILTQVVVYQNRDVEQLPSLALQQLERGELDWIALSSPSIARNLARLLTTEARAQVGKRTKLASISPITTAAALEAGLHISAEASESTWEGLFQSIVAAQLIRK